MDLINNRSNWNYLLMVVIFQFILISAVFAQSVVINDALTGGTVEGTQVGGSFTSEGYFPGVGTNHILYTVPSTATNGYVEFQVKGVDASLFPSGAEHGFIIMYDGRGIGEPVNYLPEFRENFFRWNLHWRESRSAFKAVINCAAPTSERLNSTYAVFPGSWTLEERDFTEEPTGGGLSWNPSTWYTIKVEWNDKHFKIYVDGVEKWAAHGPYDYDPIDHKIWLGSGTGKYGSDISNVVYRNFKVVDLGGSTTTNSLLVSPPSQSVESASGETLFNITSNVSWSVSESVDWITVSPISGSNNGSVTVSYDENTDPGSRSGSLTISGGGITRTVTVSQDGISNSNLMVTPTSRNVSDLSGTTSFSVVSDTNWSVLENEDWLTATPLSGSNDDEITINYNQNLTPSSRTGNITVSGGGITRNISIIQSGVSASSFLDLSPALLSVSNSSGTGAFTISSNVSWTVSDDASWLNKSPSSGSGNSPLAVAFSENLQSSSRTAIITVSGGGITKTVSVIQSSGNPYEISLTANPVEGGEVEGAGLFDDGTQITILAIPDSMWTFCNWTEGDSVVSTDSSWTFSVNSSRSLVANFKKQFEVKLSAYPNDGGSVFGDGIFNDSSEVTISARADSNWKFENWTEGDSVVSADTSWTFIINSNRNLTANFSKLLILSVSANVSQGGTVTGGGIFEKGAEVTIGAIPNTGWVFESWLENDTSVSTDSSWTFNLDSSRSFLARFSVATGIEYENIPLSFDLSQNYPNPFNPSTTISFSLPEESNVLIKLYNMLGEEVSQIIRNSYSPGTYNINFDASQLTSGMYIYSIVATGNSGKQFVESKKLILLK